MNKTDLKLGWILALLEQGDDVSGFLDEITKPGEVVYSAD